MANRCGVENLETVLRRERLRWFGHVERAGEDTVLERLEAGNSAQKGKTPVVWTCRESRGGHSAGRDWRQETVLRRERL